MQYVPSIPPPTKELEREVEVKGLSASKAVKPVTPRTLPPLVTRGQRWLHPSEGAGALDEPIREQRAMEEERRKYCRRLAQDPVLIDLRAPSDRRHQKKRHTDLATSVDEEV